MDMVMDMVMDMWWICDEYGDGNGDGYVMDMTVDIDMMDMWWICDGYWYDGYVVEISMVDMVMGMVVDIVMMTVVMGDGLSIT